MGIVYVDSLVKHSGGSVKVRFLVDSGATYTVLNKRVWEELGLKPLSEMEFILTDGTVVKRGFQRLSYSYLATVRDTPQLS